MKKEVLIQATNITKKFGQNVVLDGLNLDIPLGKIFGIVGINGSGKTTLLKILIGYYKPEKGTILYTGEDISKRLNDVRATFGFATQSNCFYLKLTVWENLFYFGRMYGLNDDVIRKNIQTILPLVKLEDAKNVLAENLSTGMQRRLDIACALIHNPHVLILDEPTEDLDPSLRREMLETIKSISREHKTTIILTSHLLEEVEYVCDDVAILHNGKIVKVGNIQAFKRPGLSRIFEKLTTR